MYNDVIRLKPILTFLHIDCRLRITMQRFFSFLFFERLSHLQILIAKMTSRKG